MKAYKVKSQHIAQGWEINRTISEVELENLKKSEVFTIISCEEAGEYKEPGTLLSQHPGFKKLLANIQA